ncbi:hypothetical protein NBRC116188_06110 [Oceaniserpentilla sp. 4NH20-0058]|uniref:ArsR/SmtB family transcription factor n=1 Tax=Oceaniserpentilla sp. 4NH20-0058 TaxID=3127660 RepID=UPI0031065F3F
MTPNDDALLAFFRGLANENRQKILFSVFIDKQPHTVGEVAERIGLAQSTTSMHLTQMKQAGILSSEKINKEVFYRVNKNRIAEYLNLVQNWLSCS